MEMAKLKGFVLVNKKKWGKAHHFHFKFSYFSQTL